MARAPRPVTPGAPYLNGVDVLMMLWDNSDDASIANMYRVKRAMEEDLHWNVTVLHEVQEVNREQISEDAYEWMHTRDGAGKLLVVCYFGHGTAQSWSETETHHEHLFAERMNDEKGYARSDLTALQSIAQSSTADVLFCLDCCWGGYDANYIKSTNPNHTVEILAAGPGNTFPLWDKWSIPLANGLSWIGLEGSRQTVADLYQHELDRPLSMNRGYYRKDCGTNSIVLSAL